jgi:hypothetical protein
VRRELASRHDHGIEIKSRLGGLPAAIRACRAIETFRTPTICPRSSLRRWLEIRSPKSSA